MSNWKDFLDSLDTPGGHIAVLLLLVIASGTLLALGVADSKEALTLSFGALLAVLRGSVTNYSRQNGKAPTA